MARGSWDPQEDILLALLVEKYGVGNWTRIAQLLHNNGHEDYEKENATGQYLKNGPLRTGKQCRERWYNQLDPRLTKDTYDEQENACIIFWQSQYGNSWATISKLLEQHCQKCRSDNSIKNHWHSFLKKRRGYYSKVLKQEDVKEHEFTEDPSGEFSSGSDYYSATESQPSPNESAVGHLTPPESQTFRPSLGELATATKFVDNNFIFNPDIRLINMLPGYSQKTINPVRYQFFPPPSEYYTSPSYHCPCSTIAFQPPIAMPRDNIDILFQRKKKLEEILANPPKKYRWNPTLSPLRQLHLDYQRELFALRLATSEL